MRAGRLRHTASVYTVSTTPDAYGALGEAGTLLGTYKCSAVPRYFQERAENGELLSRLRLELTFRFYDELYTLPPDSKVVVDGKTLVVMNVYDPTGKHAEIRMLAEERR